MKKYLIIGGAGFIGSHLSQKLLSRGNKVAVIDALKPEFEGASSPDFKSYQFDVSNAKKTAEVFQAENPDAVFYLAGPMNLRRPVSDPLFSKDLDYLERLSFVLIACHDTGVPKMVFISSGGAIYQDAKIVPTNEEYPAHPTSAYALANLQLEDHAAAYAKNNAIEMVIARLGNAYGPRQWESGFIPATIKSMVKKESPVIYGDGNQTRDFIFIDDATEALITLADKGKDEIYNVGSGKEISLNKVFALIKELLACDVGAKYQPANITEPVRSAMDIKKITKETGWTPKTGIKEGILKTIDWYAKNQKI